jgi:purine nucleoside phosphorylase
VIGVFGGSGFYEFLEGAEGTHVSAADPYCPDLRRVLLETAAELGIAAHEAAVSNLPDRATAGQRLRERASGARV